MTDTVKIAIITAITTIIIKTLTNKNKTKKNVQDTKTNTNTIKH